LAVDFPDQAVEKESIQVHCLHPLSFKYTGSKC
jgi:hypothetical protein